MREKFEGKKFSHIIHIDSLLDTPFAPTIPLRTTAETELSPLARPFLDGGLLTIHDGPDSD